MKWITRTVLAVVLILPGAAYGARGSTISTCVSCGLFKPAISLESISVGFPVSSWFPVDWDHDGTWELAISLDVNPSLVGLFDPQSAEWIAGPVHLPVTDDNWGVDDFDSDGQVEFAYIFGDTIRLLNSTGVDSALWVAPFHTDDALFYGVDSAGDKVVGLYTRFGLNLYGLDLFEVMSGVHVRKVDGARGHWRHVFDPGSTSSTSLLIYGRSSYIEHIPGFCGEVYSHAFQSYSQEWTPGSSSREGGVGYECGTPDSLKWVPMRISMGRRSSSSVSYVIWGVGCQSYGTEGLLGFTGDGWRHTWQQWASYYNPPTGRGREFAVGDLDDDGVNECYIPMADNSTWEIRDLTTGKLLSTITGMPYVDLQSGPLFKAGQPVLFYFADTSLYYYQPDVQSGILDEPTADLDSNNNFLISAFPNPFNSAVSLTWTSGVSVTSISIHNILGQTIKTMDATAAEGSVGLTWDGRDDHGQPVASGVYFARLQSREQSATVKVVLLR